MSVSFQKLNHLCKSHSSWRLLRDGGDRLERLIAVLDNLTEEEMSLYNDLVNNRYGNSVRLEQEIISYELLLEFLKDCSVGNLVLKGFSNKAENGFC